MPNLQNAKKAVRKAEVRYTKNRQVKDRLARWEKKTMDAVTAKKKDDAVKAFVQFTKLIDKAAKENVVAANKASREKSRIQTAINAL